MALELNGTTGVSAVQAGAVESGDLPAGSVIQVVSALSTGNLSTNSSTYQDLPGMVLSITPSSTSSKILVTAFVHVYTGEQDGTGYGAGGVQINRDGISIISDEDYYGIAINPGNTDGRIMAYNVKQILDAPASTSPVEYKCLGASLKETNSNVAFNTDSGFSAPGTLTLMEIAG